ncbi:MAG: sugar phosphate isomerase/epimerase [Syntrophus sp. (in: bacteria)]|nr:sugar phosphate isomerase/epimerase [Syntrophus sp. (in: bacteria)]
MKVLFSTGSLSHLPINEVFFLAREAGFDGCELVVGKNFNKPDYAEKVARCLEILPICSIHAPYVNIASWGNEKQALMRTVELAAELGAKVITFHPPSWLGREFKFYRWFRRVKDFQEEFCSDPPFLGIENMALIRLVIPPYILNNFKKMIKFGLRKNLYFTYDTTHIATCGYDIVAAFLMYLNTGRLKNVHLSDYSLWREKSHLGIGRGELPIVRLLNTMNRLGYDEMVTLEIAPQELPRTREWLLKVMTYSSAYLKLHLERREFT